ncbi:hypothetical protein M0R45_016236 [Rubus argutus]|uniref:Nuclear cap-binding protein subunit 1 n=1 Tax=Rubus argutus TaxID=59490 RepID=A0AAW1XST6_RUBAR
MSGWKSLLLRIGEKSPDYGTSSDFKEHIETCFGVLRRELEHSAHDVLQFLLQCAEQLPHKIPLYGTVIGLLNLEDEDFIRKIVEDTQSNFQDALDTGNCNKIRILMRFLTAMMCSKVLHPSSLVIVFETLLSSAATTVDEEKGNPSWQSRADFYITCILSCLPWGGAELIEQVPEEIERVMVGVEAYLSIRKHVSDTGLSFFEDDDDSAKNPLIRGFLTSMGFLEDLWDRIQVLSKNGWKLDSVPRPHLSFEAQLVNGNITYGKQKHDAESIYPQRIRRLNIFPANKTEDMQPMDRFIVEEYLLDVLFFLNGCRKECTSYMAGLPVPFRYEYLMAETIFSQLLLLPQPPFRPTYYTLVIMDLCKALPGAFPGVVAGAVRALFEKIADLDMECRTRLILWFSHHLSNFQFIWPWEEWAYVLDLPKWAPQRVFVQEVLEREVRLSYWEKVEAGNKSFLKMLIIWNESIESAPGLEELLPPKGHQTSNSVLKKAGKEMSHMHFQLPSETWMMGYRLLSNLAIVRWVFSPENIEQFHISDRSWEILRNANVVSAEEAAATAKAELVAAESKLSLMDGEPVLGGLLARALDEFEILFISLYKNFLNVLMERLPDASKVVTLQGLKSIHADSMSVDLEESSAMEVDDENGRSKSQLNGARTSNAYNVGEKEQWCMSTLGYLKAFSRQYASEVNMILQWLYMASHGGSWMQRFITENVHPLIRKTIYCGLRRSIDGL